MSLAANGFRVVIDGQTPDRAIGADGLSSGAPRLPIHQPIDRDRGYFLLVDATGRRMLRCPGGTRPMRGHRIAGPTSG
jgi:hypothetical protein